MRQQATDTIDALDRAFLNLPAAVAVSESARERALGCAHAAASRQESTENTISLAFAVEMLLAVPPAAGADCAELRQLVDAIAALTGAPRSVLAKLVEVRRLTEPGERQVSAGTAERRLTQLRFDLHDGPLQDVVLLGEDLSLFSNQLEDVLVEHPLRERIIGRLDDLEAMLVALNGDLRRIASLLESPFLRSQSFSESLAQIANTFAQRTETIPELELHGDLDQLSDSHCITLLALIREALNNIREHSRASRVSISVSSGADGLIATVFDDGRGFDPEQELIRAARGGHLGLVGMHERVRVLGGTTSIESRPGGPTVISVNLPHAVAGP
jgi:signal transduction histidine kinase